MQMIIPSVMPKSAVTWYGLIQTSAKNDAPNTALIATLLKHQVFEAAQVWIH